MSARLVGKLDAEQGKPFVAGQCAIEDFLEMLRLERAQYDDARS